MRRNRLNFYLPRQSGAQVIFFTHNRPGFFFFFSDTGRKKSRETVPHLHRLRVTRFFFCHAKLFNCETHPDGRGERRPSNLCEWVFLERARVSPSSLYLVSISFVAILLWHKNWIHIAIRIPFTNVEHVLCSYMSYTHDKISEFLFVISVFSLFLPLPPLPLSILLSFSFSLTFLKKLP